MVSLSSGVFLSFGCVKWNILRQACSNQAPFLRLHLGTLDLRTSLWSFPVSEDDCMELLQVRWFSNPVSEHCHFTSKRLTLNLLLDYHSLLEVTRSRTMQQYGRSEDLTIAKPNIITAFSMTIFLHRKHRLPFQYPYLAGVHPPLKSSNSSRKSPQG